MAREHLGLEGNGWVRWLQDGYGNPNLVRIRFTAAGDRLVATELQVSDRDGLRADQLRIPLARIERWVNAPHVRSEVLLSPEELDRSERERPRVSPRIVVPERRGRASYPAAFYRRVAAVVSAGHSANAIAEASGVPVTTATRWIKGARDRGFLPPSRRTEGGGIEDG